MHSEGVLKFTTSRDVLLGIVCCLRKKNSIRAGAMRATKENILCGAISSVCHYKNVFPLLALSIVPSFVPQYTSQNLLLVFFTHLILQVHNPLDKSDSACSGPA